MKFGKTLKAAATSLGMFAAGSWIVPCFSLTSVTQIASAVPISENSNDDTWSDSDVARAWASATGSEYDPASQVLVMQSGEDHVPVVLDQVRSEDGRSVGLSYFMVDLSLPVAEVSQQDEEFGVTTGAEFVTGRILGALDHPGYFSGVRFSMLAESGLSSNAPEQFAFLPIIAFQSAAHAAMFHAKMMRVSRGDESDGGNDTLRSGCLLNALATYQENLANAGCPAKPLPFGHSASDPTDQNELSAAPNNAHILRSEVDE